MPTASPPSRDAAVEARFFWERFKTEIVAILLLALLGIVGFGAYKFYTERRETAASTFLGQAKTPTDFQQVIARYPKTRAGADAYLLLADALRQEKKFTEANATLQRFIDKNPEHELVSSAYLAMGSNLEAMNKPDEALTLYQKTAASYPKSFNAPFALLSQVHLLRAKGKIEEARLVCEKLLTDYRESLWASEAARQLRVLKPVSVTKPAPSASVPSFLAQPSPAGGAPSPAGPAAGAGAPTPDKTKSKP